jgi:SagB-type dehydrogenase family enzyme
MDQKLLKDFLHASSSRQIKDTAQTKGEIQPPLEQPYEGELLDLPNPNQVVVPNVFLKDALMNRKSHRLYSEQSISLEQLSYALYMTQGVKKITTQNTFRTVPSAGARHAFETFILVNHVNQLEKGLYRYIALEHKLLKIDKQASINEEVMQACRQQKMVLDAAVTFIWYADFYRMSYRYDMRALRYVFLDAGHVMQNLYLVAEQFSMGTCAIAAYDDEALNSLLDLDGINQFVVYIGPLGYKK